MRVIVRDKNMAEVVGSQIYDPRISYRPNAFQVMIEVKEGVLRYNTMTRELVIDDGTSENDLVRHWFLIPEESDEKSMWQMLRAAYERKYPRKRFGRLSQCTILTTTACNAACAYCYEAGTKARNMSIEIAKDVAEYIKAHCSEPVNLKWFGGEPLMNGQVIREICESLKESSVDYYSTMVSNGALLGEYDIAKIKELWKLRWVQITLDGTKDAYLAVKRYKCGDEAVYERVLDNVRRLLENGIEVHCRLNLSRDNAEDLHNLIGDLANRFGKFQNLRVYCAPLFEGLGSPPLQMTDEERGRLYDEFIELQKYIRTKGFGRRVGIPNVRRSHCMADNGRSCVILPGGELGLCEHHTDDEYYGTIYSARYDFDVIERWSQPAAELEACRTCFYYPQCVRLEYCPTEQTCNRDIRRNHEFRIKYIMRELYEGSRHE